MGVCGNIAPLVFLPEGKNNSRKVYSNEVQIFSDGFEFIVLYVHFLEIKAYHCKANYITGKPTIQ